MTTEMEIIVHPARPLQGHLTLAGCDLVFPSELPAAMM
jgi:hypothetical protein